MKLNIWQWIGLVLLVIGVTLYIIRTSSESKPPEPDNRAAPKAAPQPAPAAPAPAPTTAPAS